MDEILNEYHQKAFEAEAAGETSGATYSPRSGFPEKTLEQETVDNLNDAGYEAYNVTAENYEALETQLKTDFADMGLDPDGSYIIAISGEESASASPDNGSRAIVPAPDWGGNGFGFNYNGTEYTMRYITVTVADESNLGRVTPIELLDEYDVDNLMNDLNLPITILSSLGVFPYTGTVYSLFSAILPPNQYNRHDSLLYRGASNWTIKYIQIYDSQDQEWTWSACTDYVNLRYFINYTYYESSTNDYQEISTNGSYGTVYAELYDEPETLKVRAALAYENYGKWVDDVEHVTYQFGGETIITHQRRNEHLGYEPT